MAHKPGSGLFSAPSIWQQDVSRAPVSADSRSLVADLAGQVTSRYGGVAAFNVYNYPIAFYRVPASEPRTDVIFDDCQGKGYTPPQLYSPAYGEPFRQVPIPLDAIPANGSDHELSIWRPATDQLWELWEASKQSDGWHACWGGRIDHVSHSPGFFTRGMGVSAAGLSLAGGTIGLSEVDAGVIDHAMNLVVVDAADASQFSYPAQRSDGDLPAGAPHAIEEGQRFRLDPSLDVSKLGLTPLGEMVARAAQKYGFIVDDKGGAVSLNAESGAGTALSDGSDPWSAVLGGVPDYAVLRNFPWDRLEALPHDWGRPSGAPARSARSACAP